MTASLFDDGTRWADLSDCGRYRYNLGRRWADDGPVMALIMFNPSTADADVDDATIRKCVKFAKREGASGLVVRNLFAFRTPKPKVLMAAHADGVDVIGPENDTWLRLLVENPFAFRPIVAAWGAGPSTLAGARLMGPRSRWLVELIGRRLHRFDDNRFRMTAGPAAPHPLYLRGDTPITPYPRSSDDHVPGH